VKFSEQVKYLSVLLQASLKDVLVIQKQVKSQKNRGRERFGRWARVLQQRTVEKY